MRAKTRNQLETRMKKDRWYTIAELEALTEYTRTSVVYAIKKMLEDQVAIKMAGRYRLLDPSEVSAFNGVKIAVESRALKSEGVAGNPLRETASVPAAGRGVRLQEISDQIRALREEAERIWSELQIEAKNL